MLVFSILLSAMFPIKAVILIRFLCVFLENVDKSILSIVQLPVLVLKYFCFGNKK